MFDDAVDLERPLTQIHLGRVGVAADKESIERRDPMGETIERHLEISRLG
jgi:hypothetical protein